MEAHLQDFTRGDLGNRPCGRGQLAGMRTQLFAGAVGGLLSCKMVLQRDKGNQRSRSVVKALSEDQRPLWPGEKSHLWQRT